MGGKKRKATSGPIKKESKYKIPRRFDCPICDAKASIAVHVVNREGHKEALIKCRNCGLGANDPPRAMLPLEKAVDAFFAFREELMEKDRAYLDRHGLDIGGVTTAATNRNSDHVEISGGSAAVMYPSSGRAATSATTTAAGVRNLAELERAIHGGRQHNRGGSGNTGGETAKYDRASAAMRDIDEDIAGTAAQYFSPRGDAESEEDEYAAMFS